MFDLAWIRELINLVEESEVDTLEISRRGTRVVLSKSPPVTARLSLADVDSSRAAAGGHPAAGGTSSPGGGDGGDPSLRVADAAAGGAVDDHLLEINSPMVGTFYRAPAPDAPPYVEVGDRVKTGQTLCILEAMKLMNELESEVAGVVREVSVQNAEPVEYGQVLFRVELDATG